MATLSEAYKDLPLSSSHIVPLDYASIKSLPESHVWLKSDDLESPDDQPLLPLVDMKDPEAVNLIGNAFERWGVVQITNHGIPLDLLEQVGSEVKSLFSLPFEQKSKALRSPGDPAGYGVARLSQHFNQRMWHEGFTVLGSPLDHAKKLWPDDHHHVHRFCDVIEDYQTKMKKLAETLMHLILKFLNIPEEKMGCIFPPQNKGEDAIATALQLNSYPLCPDPTRAMGLAPHTDTSLFTILHQTSIDGLQVFKQGVGWVSARPAHGVLLVNIGDLLQIISNARFSSVLHRVIMKETRRQRFSAAFFYSPAAGSVVSPLALSSGNFPIYRSVSVKEFIGLKAKNPLGMAFSMIRI